MKGEPWSLCKVPSIFLTSFDLRLVRLFAFVARFFHTFAHDAIAIAGPAMENLLMPSEAHPTNPKSDMVMISHVNGLGFC